MKQTNKGSIDQLIEEAVEGLDALVFYEDELAEGFERPIGSERQFVKRLNAEHMGDVEGKLIPKIKDFIAEKIQAIATKSREQGLKDSLVLAYDLADTNGLLDYGKLHRKVEKTLSKKEQL